MISPVELDPRKQAEGRVDRIAQFRAELADLETEDGLILTEEQRQRLQSHHERLLAELRRQFDVDASASTRRASWGMRIASLLGCAALVAAVVLFLHRIWAHLPGWSQVGILVVAPLLLLTAGEWSVRRRADRFYTALLLLAAGVVFVLELNALGAVLNLSPTPHALLAWSLFGLIVSCTYGLRLMLGLSLVLLVVYTGAVGVAIGGAYWGAFMERARCLIPGALVLYVAPWLIGRQSPDRFAAIYRLCGAGVGLAALLLESLSNSLLLGPLSTRMSVAVFQLAGLLASAGVVFHGLRRGEGSLVNLAAGAFVIFLYARLHAWWWDWMPKYLFFLLIGGGALGLMLGFRRLRLRLAERGTP